MWVSTLILGTVLWEKLGEEAEASPGDYGVTGSFNGWALDGMHLRDDAWSAEVTVAGDAEFQIVRNEVGHGAGGGRASTGLGAVDRPEGPAMLCA